MDIVKELTEKILQAMENPTTYKEMRKFTAWNYSMNTKKRYHGMNSVLLALVRYAKGYKSGAWTTYKQAVALGGQVKQGEKWTQIIYSSPMVKKGATTAEKDEKFWITKYYTVFNIEQTTLTPPTEEETAKENEAIQTAEEIATAYLVREQIELLKGSACYYTPTKDNITMVERNSFHTSNGYYQVLFHEMTHSTGAEKRLNRKTLTQANRFWSVEYAIEELVAEFGACLLWVNAIDVDIENAGAYIASRAKKIREENKQKEVYRAIQRASKSTEYILTWKVSNEALAVA